MPAVKKSVYDICHPISCDSYIKTGEYDAYDSMDECLESGARAAEK
jgi:hypothetical protein